ncbi:MAG: hypothetical protein PUA56_01155 [Bacillales bacterium]|nr:hypothetical protein [Bacillales bacterium]
MLDFLKTVGQGILYLILSPFIILGVLLYSVYCVFLFLFMFFKRLYMFFKGEDMKAAMRYDKVAKIHLEQQDEKIEKEKQEASNNDGNKNETTHIEKTTTIVQPIIIQTDEDGKLKNISYITPNSTTSSQENIKNTEPPLDNQEVEQDSSIDKEEE